MRIILIIECEPVDGIFSWCTQLFVCNKEMIRKEEIFEVRISVYIRQQAIYGPLCTCSACCALFNPYAAKENTNGTFEMEIFRFVALHATTIFY